MKTSKTKNPLSLGHNSVTVGHTKKKILVTGGKGMLAYDFYKSQQEKYDIILVDREECDVTSFESIMQCIAKYEPNVLLNCAAYTAVDDAEDIGAKLNYEVNTLGVYHLAKATSVFGVEFITISTDYVFDGKNPNGYKPTDACNPINAYGMAKYLGERLALDVNPRTVVIRTSWLYGGELGIMNYELGMEELRKQGKFKSFVNTMLTLAETRDEVKVVEDQHGIPTNCIDLAGGIARIIDAVDEDTVVGGVYHLVGDCGVDTNHESRITNHEVTWADFAEEIFAKYGKSTRVVRCTSAEYPTKAKRPEWSLLLPL